MGFWQVYMGLYGGGGSAVLDAEPVCVTLTARAKPVVTLTARSKPVVTLTPRDC